MKSNLTKNVYIHSLINKFLYCFITFFANIFLTRYLGTALKGEYTYLLNTASIISIVAGLGIYQSIPYYNRQYGDAEYTLLDYTNVFFFQLLLYVVIGAVCLVFMPGAVNVCLIALILLDNVTQQYNMLMLIRDVYKRNKIFLLGAIISIVLYGVLYLCVKPTIIIALVATIAVKVYYLVAYIRAIGKPIKVSVINVGRIKKYIAFGYLPMITFLLITMNYKVDVIMLKWFPQVDATELSFYSLGVTVAEIAWIVSDVFKDVIFAKTADANHYDEVSAAIRVSNAIMVVIVLGMVVFGKPFIWIFYGKEFIDSYSITVWLMLGVPLMSWFKILHPLFNALGKRWFSFLSLLATVMVNVVMNAMLIPHFGIYGAACASIASYFVCGVSFLGAYSKEVGEKIYKLFIPSKQDFLTIFKSK